MFKAKGAEVKRMKKNEFEYRETGKQILMLPIDAISPNPSQPRCDFDEVAIVNLADSIRQHGLIQPITVRKAENAGFLTDHYYVIAGERRLRAFRMLGKESIPAILVETTSLRSAELAIIENIMRKDLNMFEYAQALATLIEKYEITQEELAEKMSTSQSNIANKLRLLRFPSDEQQYILSHGLSERHARALLRLTDLTVRHTAAEYIVSHSLNVKQAEQYIDKLLIPDEKEAPDPFQKVTSFCDSLVRSLAGINKTGIPARSTRFETDSEIKIVINIPKSVS